MNKNLIDELLTQHSLLVSIFADVGRLSEDGKPSYAEINRKLKDLGKLLVEHVYLENNFLYTNIFKNPMNDRASFLSAEKFLEEMTSIQKGVMMFLNRYNDEEKIRAEFEDFKDQLKVTDEIINTRIKLEEECLFKCYDDHSE